MNPPPFISLPEDPQPTFSCPICFIPTPISSTFSFPSCSHMFCKPCLNSYVQAQISAFNVLKIKCPQNNCPYLVSEKDLKLFESALESPIFTKLQSLITQKTSNKAVRPLTCPRPGCLRSVTPSGNTANNYILCVCETKICIQCGENWHENKTCLEVLDPEFQAYAIENNLKPCIICKSVVDRVEGCTHITCPICDYEWCWLCGREYKDNHERKCLREWDKDEGHRAQGSM